MSNKEQILKLSGEVLRFSRNTICVNLRFMDAPLSRLMYVAAPKIFFGTDGRHLAYNPAYLLKCYTKSSNFTAQMLFHSVLHCVFRHNFIGAGIDRRLWDIACDIAVAGIIGSFDSKAFETQETSRRMQHCAKLENDVGLLTAEILYRYFSDMNFPQSRLDTLAEIFCTDDHSLWYMDDDKKAAIGIGQSGAGDGSDNQANDSSDNNNSDGQRSDTSGI